MSYIQTMSNMGVFPYSNAVIHDEFQRMKTLREIALNDAIIAFLEEAHASLKANGATNPQGPSKRSFLHCCHGAAVGRLDSLH